MIKGKKGKTQEENQDKNDEKFEVKIDVNIGDKKITEDLEDALYIPTVDKLNSTILANMMASIPSLHARWNFIYNEAVYEYDMSKTRLEVWESNAEKKIREELKKIESRVTDKMVEGTKKMDPEFKRYSKDVVLAKRNMNHIKALANGFGEKGEKIVSIASLLKMEMENLGKGKNVLGKKEYGHIKYDKKEEKIKSDPDINDGWPTD